MNTLRTLAYASLWLVFPMLTRPLHAGNQRLRVEAHAEVNHSGGTTYPSAGIRIIYDFSTYVSARTGLTWSMPASGVQRYEWPVDLLVYPLGRGHAITPYAGGGMGLFLVVQEQGRDLNFGYAGLAGAQLDLGELRGSVEIQVLVPDARTGETVLRWGGGLRGGVSFDF